MRRLLQSTQRITTLNIRFSNIGYLCQQRVRNMSAFSFGEKEDETNTEETPQEEALFAPEIHKKSEYTPRLIVQELDRFIVGQKDAKRAVAIALRNRWRRKNLPSEIKEEVHPKNILMVGPTGVGKTEIARRLAKLAQAPFIKVEATNYTEVGFVGKDVDSIINDLVRESIELTKKNMKKRVEPLAKERAVERILDALVGPASKVTRDRFREQLLSGALDEQTVTVKVRTRSDASQYMGGKNVERQLRMQFMKLLQGSEQEYQEIKDTVKNNLRRLIDDECEKMIPKEGLMKQALQAAEEDGIIFIDEIDKVCTSNKAYYRGSDVSGEGVQRDLLPIIEGTVVQTDYGPVRTDNILFIACGAFHSSKPSDLLPELQGRLPVRVELKGLSEEDLYRILKEPEHNLIKQNIELLKTENVNLVFTDEAIKVIAKSAAEVNRSVENIGARRLYTILEKIIEDISFEAPDMEPGTTVEITVEKVKTAVNEILGQKGDYRKLIL